MIRLTKSQKEIEELAGRVPNLTESQMEWAVKDYTYFQWIKTTDKKVCCPSCHEDIPLEGRVKNKRKYKMYHKDIEGEFVCPHCGAKILVRNYDKGYKEKESRKYNHLQENFFEVLNVVGDWQVTRLIYMCCCTYIKKENTKWQFHECCQAWNNPKTDDTYFRALPKKVFASWYYNPYSIYEWAYEENPDEETYHRYIAHEHSLVPRRVNGSNFFETRHIAPRPQIHKQYKRMGLTADFLRRNITRSAIGWFAQFGGKSYKPMWETLIKAKEYKLIYHMGVGRSWKKHDELYFNAWKITKRHHYKVDDIVEWLDMLDMLKEAGMDYRNPKYVCPASVHEMHQQMLEIKKAKQRREEQERERKELMEVISKYDDKYTKRIAKYLNMDIHDDSLSIVVLPNISAFYEEGLHMCHCVYRCRYYLHDDSLIMSARDSKGKRWETIEVSLKDFTIIQSYGYGDKHTAKHKEILNLVESNMWQVKQRMKMVA